jgi:hypothetical protein
MEINLTSSLTPEDENQLAVVFLDAIGGILDLLPIAYALRIKTPCGKTLERTHCPLPPAPPGPASVVKAALAVVEREPLPVLQDSLLPCPERPSSTIAARGDATRCAAASSIRAVLT